MMGPLLDVTDILVDPMIADHFDVIRRVQTVSTTTGRPSNASTTYSNRVGVVTMAHGNDLKRLPEEQRMGRVISVITKFRVQGPSAGVDADLVVWKGDQFVVMTVDPYTRYGAGFVQVIAASIDNLDTPP